jgi:PST family polysaccharide transporter
LYGVQAANIVVPLLTLPYLTRVLGAEPLGYVLVAQSFALWISIVLEYGFTLSATREVAQHHHQTSKLSSIVSGVQGAKLLLGLATILIALVSAKLVPVFQQHPDFLWWAMLWAFGQGFSPIWFFQGIQRLLLSASLDIVFRLFGNISILVLVKSPEDANIALIILSISTITPTLILTYLMYTQVLFELPKLKSIQEAFKFGKDMFFYRLLASLYTVSNAFVLGIISSPTQVGYYGSAERIYTASTTAFWPFWRAFFPHVSIIQHQNPKRARQLIRQALLVIGFVGLLVGSALWLSASNLIPRYLGSEFSEIAPVVQLLALAVPCIAVSGSLGLQWLLSTKREHILIGITATAGLINLILAIFLVPSQGARGMAFSILIAEFFAATAMLAFFLIESRIKP